MNLPAKALAVALVMAIGGIAMLYTRQQATIAEVKALTSEKEELVANIAALESRVTELTNQASGSAQGPELAEAQMRELLQLRNEVNQLRQGTNELGRALNQSQKDLSVASRYGTGTPGTGSKANGEPVYSFTPGTIRATAENTPIPSSTLPARPPDPPFLQTTYDFARLGSVEQMKAMLESHPEFLNAPVGIRGSTLLHTAAYNDHSDVIQELIGRGAMVNQKNVVGETPLYSGVLRGGKESIEALLKAGADPGLPDNNGLTPLKLATDRKFTDVADLLRKYGAKE